jgi:hypothetical protein
MSDEPEMTPITPEESGEMPPKVAPFNPVVSPDAADNDDPPTAMTIAPQPSGVSTIKLKPVIRKPMIRKPTIGGTPKPAAPAAPAPADAAAAAPAAPSKKATQSLAAVSDQMPAQAVLRKTGIIAEGIITPAQQQAAKSKTSRISLESAIGVAPAKESPAPLKTIRLRRPTELKHPAPSPLKPVGTPEAAPSITSAETIIKSAETIVKEDAPTVVTTAPSDDADSSTTQKKTLKLHRPSGLGVKRPTLGIKKPGEPAAPAAAPSDGGDVPDMPADMGDVPELKPLAPMDLSAMVDSDMSAGVPGWVAALSLVTSIAALLVLGAVVYFLYQEGVGPVAGANEMQFIQM